MTLCLLLDIKTLERLLFDKLWRGLRSKGFRLDMVCIGISKSILYMLLKSDDCEIAILWRAHKFGVYVKSLSK